MTFNLYGLVLGIAILASFQASLLLTKRRKMETKMLEGLFWWVVAGGVVGARLYHVVDKWQEIYSLDPKSILYIWNGGLGIWGAVIGGIIAYSLWHMAYGKKYKAGFVNVLDVILFGVPLGQAIGRWGNFFNDEIIGKNGEPLFLYESVLDLILFGILVLLAKRDSSTSVGMTRKGTIAGVYLISYGLIRISLEPLRPENMIWKIGNIPTASLISAMAILAGLFLFLGKFENVRS